MMKQQILIEDDNENVNPHLSHFIENITESEHNYPDTFINNSIQSKQQMLPTKAQSKHSKSKCSDVLKNLKWEEAQSPNTHNNTSIESIESIFNYSNKYKHKTSSNNNISPHLPNQKELSMLSSIPNNKRPHSSNILPKYKHKSKSNNNNNNNEQSSIMDIPISNIKRNKCKRHSQINLKAKYIITLEQNFNIKGIPQQQQQQRNTKVKKKKHHKHKHKKHNKEHNFDLSDSEISDINLSAISQLKRDIINKRKSQKINEHKCNTNSSLNVNAKCNRKLKLDIIQCIKKSKSMIDEVCWSRDDNNDNTFLDHSTLLIMKDLDSGKKQNKKELNEKLLLKKKKVVKNKNIVNNSNNKIGSNSKSKSKSKSILKKDNDSPNKGNVVLQYNEEKTKSKNKQNKKSSNSNSKITSKSKTSNNTNRSSSNNNNNIRNKSNSRLTLNADKPKQTFSPNTSRKNSQSPKNETNKQNKHNNTNNTNNTNNIKHLKVHQTKLPKCKGKNTPIKNNNNNTNTNTNNNNNNNNNNSQPQQTKLMPSSKNPLPNIPKIQTKITPIQLKNVHHAHSPSYKHILHNNNNTNTNNNLLHSSPTQILDESQCKRITRDRSHRQPFSGISQEYIDKKKQFFMDLMRDPNNPYSLYWSNKMLSKGFGVTTNVKGTLNCVPNLGLINFNNSHSQLPYTNSTIYSPEELSTITKIKRCQYEHLKHNNNNDNHNDKSLSHNASTFYNISKYYIPKTTERTSSCNTKLKLVQYPSIYKYFQ